MGLKEKMKIGVVQLVGGVLRWCFGEVEGLQWWGRWGSSSMAWSLREKVRGVNGMREREHGVLWWKRGHG